LSTVIKFSNSAPTPHEAASSLGFWEFGGRYVEHCHPVLSFIHSGTPLRGTRASEETVAAGLGAASRLISSRIRPRIDRHGQFHGAPRLLEWIKEVPIFQDVNKNCASGRPASVPTGLAHFGGGVVPSLVIVTGAASSELSASNSEPSPSPWYSSGRPTSVRKARRVKKLKTAEKPVFRPGRWQFLRQFSRILRTVHAAVTEWQRRGRGRLWIGRASWPT
jgi:hypothetical protein